MTKKLTPAMMAGLILLGFVGSAHAADLLILKSTQPSLPEGFFIDDADPLSLPAGAELTLVDEAGNKIILKGPYSGVPTARKSGNETGLGSRMLMALAQLIVGPAPSARTMGATRGAPAARVDDFWLLNVSASGDHCLRTDIPTTLWRPKADKAEKLSIKRHRSRQWVRAEWPAGDNTLDWPGGMDLVDDATYLVRLGSGIAVSRVVVHLVPKDLPSDFHRVAWMTRKGCKRQARAFLSRLK